AWHDCSFVGVRVPLWVLPCWERLAASATPSDREPATLTGVRGFFLGFSCGLPAVPRRIRFASGQSAGRKEEGGAGSGEDGVGNRARVPGRRHPGEGARFRRGWRRQPGACTPGGRTGGSGSGGGSRGRRRGRGGQLGPQVLLLLVAGEQL